MVVLGPKLWFLGPNPPRLGVSIFKKITKIGILSFFGSKMVKKKVEIEGGGTPLVTSAPKFGEIPR